MAQATLKIFQVISQALQNGWVQSPTHSQALHSATECLLSRPCRVIQGEVFGNLGFSPDVKAREQERKSEYYVTLRRGHVTTVTVGTQRYILCFSTLPHKRPKNY